MFKNIDKWILIALVVVVLIIVLRMNKMMAAQTNVLAAMAEKLGASHEPAGRPELIDYGRNEIPEEETEEDGRRIVEIAEKLYSGKALTADEKQFNKKFPSQIAQEVEFSKQLHALADKFAAGETNFTDQEKAFYEENKDIIDEEVARLKEKKEQPIIVSHPASEQAKANPPLAQGERLKLILSFFEDGVPKTVTQLADLYAQRTGTKPSKGNISLIFGKLVKEGKLLCKEITHEGRNKVFHGLPEWFDGRKLKSEYKIKIS